MKNIRSLKNWKKKFAKKAYINKIFNEVFFLKTPPPSTNNIYVMASFFPETSEFLWITLLCNKKISFSLVHLLSISLIIQLAVVGGWWCSTFCNFVQFLLFAENHIVANKWQLLWLPKHTVVHQHWFHYWLFRGMW